MAIAAAGCSSPSFVPQDSPNPWADTYESVAPLDSQASWAAYNVHDPCIRKFGDTYYSYSTDAIWFPPRKEGDTSRPKPQKVGNIQVRSSKDLVNWQFHGWAFDNVPAEAWDYVFPISGDRTSRGLWAPFVVEHNGVYRMYYCLSTFGSRVSCIGLAESISPMGPWEPKGIVVKTSDSTAMNAIDPSIVDDAETGKQWMIYGSFFGGIFAMELDKETGLAKTEGDLGKMIAHRQNWQNDNMEAPEVIYNPATKKYYLFVSYGPLFTTYNVRVSVADHPDGPYTDYFGTDVSGEVNTFPVLTAPYKFDNHAGWQGVAHNTCFSDGNGNWYSASQARPIENPGMMDLAIRKMYFRADGWPMISPERYAGDAEQNLEAAQVYGDYEIVSIQDREVAEDHADGQSKDGLQDAEINKSVKLTLSSDNVKDFASNTFTLVINNSEVKGVKAAVGHDWENKKTTIIITGIDNQGFAVWGKKIK